MTTLEEEQLVPPRLRRKVRRYEIAAGLAVALLLVVVGLTHTVGAARDTGSGDVLRTRRFRPLVADFHGAVEYRAFGTKTWRALRWSDGFEQGDQLRTGAEATCDVLLTWGTGVHVAENTEITWSRLASRGAVKEVEVKLGRGKVLASLDNLPDGSLFEVVTRHSRTRVKGTTLSVSADGDKTHVTVLEGVVEVVDTTDPNRRVQVTAGSAVDAGGAGGLSRVMPLSATERAKLLGEISRVDKRIERVAPREPKATRATKATGAEPTKAPGAQGDGSGGAASEGADGDEEAVRDILGAVVELINGGRVAEALEYCTPTFRALVWGPSARRLGVPEEFRLSEGEGKALQIRNQIAQSVRIRLEVVRLEVVVERDVAYGSAVLKAEAVSKGEVRKTGSRSYACTARLLKGKDGRWLLDLATATEGAEGVQ